MCVCVCVCVYICIYYVCCDNISIGSQVKETIDKNFAKALEIEPNCVEAYTRLAQFNTMIGNNEEALDLLAKAIEHVRYRDEVGAIPSVAHFVIVCHSLCNHLSLAM